MQAISGYFLPIKVISKPPNPPKPAFIAGSAINVHTWHFQNK